MSRQMWMLPCPFKLKRGEFGRETMDDHLHNPWSTVSCLPSTLCDFTVVLPLRLIEAVSSHGLSDSEGRT